MPRVWVRSHLDERDPETVLRRVTEFKLWPEVSESVRSVEVEPQADGSEITTWEVVFHQGLMRWRERDWLELDDRRARFALIDGDPHLFEGCWQVEGDGRGIALIFNAEFDLGMPSLSHVLDPIAVEAVEDAIESVVRGLYGGQIEVEFTDAAPVGAADS